MILKHFRSPDVLSKQEWEGRGPILTGPVREEAEDEHRAEDPKATSGGMQDGT